MWENRETRGGGGGEQALAPPRRRAAAVRAPPPAQHRPHPLTATALPTEPHQTRRAAKPDSQGSGAKPARAAEIIRPALQPPLGAASAAAPHAQAAAGGSPRAPPGRSRSRDRDRDRVHPQSRPRRPPSRQGAGARRRGTISAALPDLRPPEPLLSSPALGRPRDARPEGCGAVVQRRRTVGAESRRALQLPAAPAAVPRRAARAGRPLPGRGLGAPAAGARRPLGPARV